MSRPSLDNQGRSEDVQAPEWNWGFIGVLLFPWLLIGLVVAGIIAWGLPFIAGLGLMFVGLVALVCWSLGESAPW